MSKNDGDLERRRESIDPAPDGAVLAHPGRDASVLGASARVSVAVVPVAGTLPIVAPNHRRDARQPLRATRLADLAERGVQLPAAMVRRRLAADRVRELTVGDRKA